MLIDLLIIGLAISAIIRNRHSGFIHQLLASVGFFAGLFLGRLVEHLTIHLAHSPLSRVLVTIITVLGLALVGLTIGEHLGLKVKYRFHNSRINNIDNLLGGLLSIGSILFSAWLAASIIMTLPANRLQAEIKQSQIIATLDRILPPVPRLISDIGHLIDPNGFPDVFIGNEPIPRGNVNLPSLGDLNKAVNLDKDSVDRIQGIGCGGIVSGSGFVVGPGLVATNAHVVAGLSHPYIEDVNGRHSSEVVWFDPNLDFAILKSSGLAGQPLSITSASQSPGTPSAVLGYPGGGNFTADPAAVLDEFIARGHNIYGYGITFRNVYEIQADVIPGNSGGPLIGENGNVIGVVFAQSITYDHVGYALTTSKLASEIKQAEQNPQAVSSGQCTD